MIIHPNRNMKRIKQEFSRAYFDGEYFIATLTPFVYNMVGEMLDNQHASVRVVGTGAFLAMLKKEPRR